MAAEEAVEAFFRAVDDGDVAEVGRLLDEDGRLVEARVRYGSTPLFVAARKGHVDVVRLLLGRGADIEASTHGVTPLISALVPSSNEEVVEEVVEVLLDWGADANKAGPMGATPLMLAVGLKNMGAVKRLFRALGGQGLNAQMDTGGTAFWGASNMGQADIARLLLLEGADHTIAHHDGLTAQMRAESKGHEECVALIQVRMQSLEWCVMRHALTTRMYALLTTAFVLIIHAVD
jgi:ankyrin repeat protein